MGLSFPGDITAPPILSDEQIDTIVTEILDYASETGNEPDELLLARWSQRFNRLFYSDSSDFQLVSEIDNIFDVFVNYSQEKFRGIKEKNDTKLSEKFIYMVNFFLKLLKIKKIYNTIPRQDFTDFHRNEDHTQILQLSLRRDQDIGMSRMSHGGSCHNWSIIFKEYFDELRINASVILCSPYSNHSFTLVELNGHYYIFDPILRRGPNYLFEVSAGSTIFVGQDLPARIIEITAGNEGILHLQVEISQNKKGIDEGSKDFLKSYDSLDSFTDDLDSREIDYIIFGYRRVDNSGFEIDFNRENRKHFHFSLTLGEKGNPIEIDASITIEEFLLRFLESFFSRKFRLGDLQKILKQYYLAQKGDENTLEQEQNSFLSNSERDMLIEWISESTNYQLFEAFISAQSERSPFKNAFFSKNKAELQGEFKKATHLMHKRSVIKFLLLGVLVSDLESIVHKKDTYSRKTESPYQYINRYQTRVKEVLN